MAAPQKMRRGFLCIPFVLFLQKSLKKIGLSFFLINDIIEKNYFTKGEILS